MNPLKSWLIKNCWLGRGVFMELGTQIHIRNHPILPFSWKKNDGSSFPYYSFYFITVYVKSLSHLYIAISGINWDVKTFRHIVQLVILRMKPLLVCFSYLKNHRQNLLISIHHSLQISHLLLFWKEKQIIAQQTRGWKWKCQSGLSWFIHDSTVSQQATRTQTVLQWLRNCPLKCPDSFSFKLLCSCPLCHGFQAPPFVQYHHL